MKPIINLLFLVLSFIFTININAQIITFDGNNCDLNNGDEWGIADVTDIDNINPGTADITHFWYDQDNTYIYIAFLRESTGNSSFSFYINTDCDTSTGATAFNGSEIAAFFNVGGGIVSDTNIYTYNGTQFVLSGLTFDAILGEESCNGSDGLFIEARIEVDLIFNLCDTSSSPCNSISIEVGASLAGGSPNSALKDEFEVPFISGINSNPVADFEGVDTCLGSTIMVDGSNSTFYDSTLYNSTNYPDFNDSIELYEWDFDYNNGTFNPSETGVIANHNYFASGVYIIALQVTDSYGCTDIFFNTIDVFDSVNPEFSITPDNSCGYTLNFNASSTNDPTGGNNLIFDLVF